MTVFDLMTGGDEENINQAPSQESQESQERKPSLRKNLSMENVKDKIEFYSDYDLHYQDIAMPEVSVTVYYETKDGVRQGEVDTRMKLGRVLRYQHLARDFVDEDDYPPSQEYFLYADNQVPITIMKSVNANANPRLRTCLTVQTDGQISSSKYN